VSRPVVSTCRVGVTHLVDLPPFTSLLLHESSVDSRHDLIELRAVISSLQNYFESVSQVLGSTQSASSTCFDLPIRNLLHQSGTSSPVRSVLPLNRDSETEYVPRVIIGSFSDFGFSFRNIEDRVLGLVVVRLDVVHCHL
jgi:hypothetical protein